MELFMLLSLSALLFIVAFGLSGEIEESEKHILEAIAKLKEPKERR